MLFVSPLIQWTYSEDCTQVFTIVSYQVYAYNMHMLCNGPSGAREKCGSVREPLAQRVTARKAGPLLGTNRPFKGYLIFILSQHLCFR
jgi:hypothetical protein